MEDIVKELLDKLESHILSCDNIVTYKWISQKWNIHVNTAKQLLFSFVNNEKSKKNPVDLEVTYFLSGSLKDCDDVEYYQVSLVREKDLLKAKSKLTNIVSEHIYGIQKSTLKDLHDIYVVDKVNGCDILQEKCGKGSIKCKAAVPNTTNSLAKLRLNAVLPAQSSVADQTKIKDQASYGKKSQNSLKVDNATFKEDESKEKLEEAVTVVNGKTKKDGQKGIAGMFAAQNGKNVSKKSETESENASSRDSPKYTSKKPIGKKNGIATLFAKQAQRPPVNKTKKEELKKKVEPPKKVVQEIEIDEDPFASEDEEDERRKLITKEVVIHEDSGKSPIESSCKANVQKKKRRERKNKRMDDSDGEEEAPLPSKKRRRIRVMSSGEDSSAEEMEIGECESPIPHSPKELPKEVVISDDDDDIIPATPCESPGKGAVKRRRKRTLVNRTFADDKGFIVTRKEYVFESCTDDSSHSGDEKTKANGNVKSVNEIGSLNGGSDMGKEKKNKASEKDEDEVVSAEEENTAKKGKKKKEPGKGKKPVSKKISPQNVRQGVLTSFFKRS